jgi:uncharacterized membrane protein
MGETQRMDGGRGAGDGRNGDGGRDAGAADPGHDRQPDGFWPRWRKNFLTGLVLVAPLYLTVWIIWSGVGIIDAKVERLLPAEYNLQTYVNIPGYGLAVFLVVTALIGAVAKNFVTMAVIRWSEWALDRLPIVRTVYNGLKQIAETVLTQSKSSFTKACLVEYPRKGLWAVAFISSESGGEVAERVGGDIIGVFLPTTPNPTSGFLLYVPREDVIELDMSVEEAAKLIISGGMVAPGKRGKRREGTASAPPVPPPAPALEPALPA